MTQKRDLSDTDKKSKAITEPWFTRLLRYLASTRGLFWDAKHTHTHITWLWSGVAITHLSWSTKLTYVGPVSTEVGDCVRVQFPVPDIYISK